MKFTFLICLLLSLQTFAREWVNKDGKSIEAEFVSSEGDAVTLLVGKKTFTVPLATLSESDQEFARRKAFKLREKKTHQKFPLPLKKWISGDKLLEAEVAGKPVVFHAWQAYCGACPASLLDFEKMARRKKHSGAVFMIFHSHDKVELAQKESEKLDLGLPIYHGRPIKWDEKRFGPMVWPHLVVMDGDGKVVYMGPEDRKFKAALDAVTEGL